MPRIWRVTAINQTSNIQTRISNGNRKSFHYSRTGSLVHAKAATAEGGRPTSRTITRFASHSDFRNFRSMQSVAAERSAHQRAGACCNIHLPVRFANLVLTDLRLRVLNHLTG